MKVQLPQLRYKTDVSIYVIGKCQNLRYFQKVQEQGYTTRSGTRRTRRTPLDLKREFDTQKSYLSLDLLNFGDFFYLSTS